MSANIAPFLKAHMHDQNGQPLVGGKIYSYIAGSTTLLATFTDETGLQPNTNPLILDANGEYSMFLKDHYYKFVITDANDVVLRTIERIKGQSEAGDAATYITSIGVGPWYAPQSTDNVAGAIKSELNGFEIFKLSKDADQVIRKVVTVPDNFASGPITMKASYFSAALLGAGKFRMTATLISKFAGAAVTDQLPTYTEDLTINFATLEAEADISAPIVANLLRTASFNLCQVDNLGANIDGTPVIARDQILVEIKRIVVANDVADDICFMQHGAEERFA